MRHVLYATDIDRDMAHKEYSELHDNRYALPCCCIVAQSLKRNFPTHSTTLDSIMVGYQRVWFNGPGAVSYHAEGIQPLTLIGPDEWDTVQLPIQYVIELPDNVLNSRGLPS